MTALVALHGFLGRGSDWDAVRAASRAPLDWICPDLFSPEAGDFAVPPVSPDKAWLAGYSFGARLALRWLQAEPDRWHGALLLSANPGNFQTDAERSERAARDRAWARRFGLEDWDTLVADWHVQEVLAGGPSPRRGEKDFDRAKLARALVEYSVADQFTDPQRLDGSFVWMAGTEDAKFVKLLGSMRTAGFPGSFFTVPPAGHRLLSAVPDVVASALDRLVSGKP
jgi:2-succinyl-6-hydroxy-2,4-cyclohexadiene-1-carboxylate synthase